jgi:hypothetical protein
LGWLRREYRQNKSECQGGFYAGLWQSPGCGHYNKVVENLSKTRWEAYRTETFRLGRAGKLRNEDDAVQFVNERGFVYFWPNKGVDLPSLWGAVAGSRPVADKHDDPGHVTWRWKDKLLPAKRWYYGKLVRGKATMVALHSLKYFYALSENTGDPNDYMLEYEAGRLSTEARQVYEALLGQGALDTLALRREARLTGNESNARFERALVELQRGLRVLPVGVAAAGRWKYAFIYELVDRWFPEVVEQARSIGRGSARAHLLDLYLTSVGAATEQQAANLFRWRRDEAAKAAAALEASGRARPAEVVAGQNGAWWVTAGC